MATAAESSKFMSDFIKAYKKHYGIAYKLNRNTAKWAARDVLDSYPYDDCMVALQWAFDVRKEPFSWEWFTNNLDKLLAARNNWVIDMQARYDRRKMAEEWLKNE